MRAVAFLALAGLSVLAIAAETSHDPTEKVLAEGVGLNSDDALKDAFRNAVRQVVGAVVDGETLIKNEQVISDNVLTYSAGFITSFEKVQQKEENGLFRVKIAAVVERRGIVTKLKEANVSVKVAEGKDLAASAITRKEGRENSAALLSKQFAELHKVLKAEVGKPTAKDFNEDTGILTLAVVLKVDRKAYDAFVKNFAAIADRACLRKDLALIEAEQGQLGNQWSHASLEKLAGPRLKETPKEWAAVLCTQMDGNGLRSRWTGYVFDCDAFAAITGTEGKLRINLSLLDAAGQIITEDVIEEFAPESRDSQDPHRLYWLGKLGTVHRGKADGGYSLFSHSARDSGGTLIPLKEASARGYYIAIGPMFHGRGVSDWRDFYALDLAFKRKIKLSLEELRRLKEIRCSVVLDRSSAGDSREKSESPK